MAVILADAALTVARRAPTAHDPSGYPLPGARQPAPPPLPGRCPCVPWGKASGAGRKDTAAAGGSYSSRAG